MRNSPDEWPPLGEELCSPAPTARFRPVVIATQIEASPYQISYFSCVLVRVLLQKTETILSMKGKGLQTGLGAYHVLTRGLQD